MQAGIITVDGNNVGTIEVNLSEDAHELESYVPMGHMEHEDTSVRLGHQRGFYPGTKHEHEQGTRLGHKHGHRTGEEHKTVRLGHKHGFHPKTGAKPSSGEHVHDGSYGRTGGGTEANYLGSARARAAGIESGPSEHLTTVDTKAGKITVNKSAAADMAGAVNDLVEAGAPVGHIGSHAHRNIAGSGRLSQHAYGGAMDLFNQTGRGVISREGMNWIKANPDKWKEIKQKHNLVGGEEFGDIGHVEWGGPGYGERHYNKKTPGPSSSSGDPTIGGLITGKTTPNEPVRGSWFDDQNTATGLSAREHPGIALPSREGLGKMHEVTGPNGQKVMLPQIDVGPAKRTGRGIDISKGALKKFGYTTGDFPTDANFTYRQVPTEKKIDPSTEPM